MTYLVTFPGHGDACYEMQAERELTILRAHGCLIDS